MNANQRSETLGILKEQRQLYRTELEFLQLILCDLKHMGDDGFIPKGVKEYVDKKKVRANARKKIEIIADLDCIIIALSDEEPEVEILGGLYDGNIYPELKEVIEKAGLKLIEEDKLIPFD